MKATLSVKSLVYNIWLKRRGHSTTCTHQVTHLRLIYIRPTVMLFLVGNHELQLGLQLSKLEETTYIHLYMPISTSTSVGFQQCISKQQFVRTFFDLSWLNASNGIKLLPLIYISISDWNALVRLLQSIAYLRLLEGQEWLTCLFWLYWSHLSKIKTRFVDSTVHV